VGIRGCTYNLTRTSVILQISKRLSKWISARTVRLGNVLCFLPGHCNHVQSFARYSLLNYFVTGKKETEVWESVAGGQLNVRKSSSLFTQGHVTSDFWLLFFALPARGRVKRSKVESHLESVVCM